MKPSFLSHVDRLHEQATAATGLTDFGDPFYLEGLRELLEARDASGIDYPGGGSAILDQVSQRLTARLRSIDQLKRLDGTLPPIVAPIFVLGLPRTGTTAMQRLLMADPQMQGLEYWLGEQPKPRPPRDQRLADPGFVACQATLDAIDAAAPEIMRMHHMAAAEGEECRLVMEQSFGHSSFSLVAPIRPYQDWLFAADLTPHYTHYKAVLGLIGANDPARTWVLKCPHHAPQIDSLLKIFPDARIVLMHRPVEDLVPSVARLAEAFLRLVEGDGLDMEKRSRLIIDNLDLTLRRLLAVRDANRDRFFDLSLDRFVADPAEAAAAVFDRFSIPMPAVSRNAIAEWVAANHHRGETSTARSMPYGLDRAALAERFSYYRG